MQAEEVVVPIKDPVLMLQVEEQVQAEVVLVWEYLLLQIQVQVVEVVFMLQINLEDPAVLELL
jgi:hypothetical protein